MVRRRSDVFNSFSVANLCRNVILSRRRRISTRNSLKCEMLRAALSMTSMRLPGLRNSLSVAA
jgi:hypothetical protein